MVNGGFRITKDTSYELTFDKPVENIAVAVLMGSKYDSQPNARVSYTFAQVNDTTRVVADVAIITNPGSAFERLMQASIVMTYRFFWTESEQNLIRRLHSL